MIREMNLGAYIYARLNLGLIIDPSIRLTLMGSRDSNECIRVIFSGFYVSCLENGVLVISML